MANYLRKIQCFSLLSQLLLVQTLFAADAVNPVTELEAKLLNVAQVSLEFEIIATGGVEADLRGSLALRGKQGIELAVTGTFAGEDLDLVMHSTDAGLLFGSKDAPRSIAMPAAIRESIVVGFTRMGILHNIARLAGGSPPDRGEGGVSGWVTVNSVAKSADGRHLSFDIVVAGQPSGSAVLLLDPFGMVVKRDQAVEFPGGTMVVVENYSNIQVSF